MTRWKVINNTLGLPFPEPQETYSTSEHLFHDQGIDRAVTGRLVPLPPRVPSGRSGRDGRSGGDDRLSGKDEATEDAEREQRRKARPKRDRTRRRLRNGVAVEAGSETADVGSTPSEAPSAAEPTAPVDAGQTSAAPATEGDAPKRRRRRRRGGSGRSDTGEQTGTDSQEASGAQDSSAHGSSAHGSSAHGSSAQGSEDTAASA
jgi:hypothetical protein